MSYSLLIFAGLLSASIAVLVPISTEAAMRDKVGAPIFDCLEPKIYHYDGLFYAYGFMVRSVGPEFPNFGVSIYTSPDIASGWEKVGTIPMNSTEIPLWYVLYNEKNSEYVAYGAVYSVSTTVYTSQSPAGPFSGVAYMVYNSFDAPVAQRHTYIYQLNDDYYDIIPATFSNTTAVMEGLWIVKNGNTYFLLGSGLVGFNVDDNFYLTSKSPLGPWTYRGLFAPAGSNTFQSQTFQGLELSGAKGTIRVYIGHRWKQQVGDCFPNATSIWLPLVFGADAVAEMAWYDSWTLDTEGTFYAQGGV